MGKESEILSEILDSEFFRGFEKKKKKLDFEFFVNLKKKKKI